MIPPCRQCHAGIHSKCEGDFTAHCGCRACYGHDYGPFYRPPDGVPWVAASPKDDAALEANPEGETNG